MAKLSNNNDKAPRPLPCAVLLNDPITGNRLTSRDTSSPSLEPANVTLFGKRVFWGVMKLRVLRRDGPGLARGALSAITRWESEHTHTQRRRPREEGAEELKMLHQPRRWE